MRRLVTIRAKGFPSPYPICLRPPAKASRLGALNVSRKGKLANFDALRHILRFVETWAPQMDGKIADVISRCVSLAGVVSPAGNRWTLHGNILNATAMSGLSLTCRNVVSTNRSDKSAGDLLGQFSRGSDAAVARFAPRGSRSGE